jgi:predicted metal-dependent phosphoesterase TrpH
LIDHLVSEQFGLVAITDHDRPDTAESLQRLALEKHLPVLVAVEMTTKWNGGATDVLCYGFDPQKNQLKNLAQDIARRQQENSIKVYENLRQKGYWPRADKGDSQPPDELTTILEKPAAQQPNEWVAFLMSGGIDENTAWERIIEAGFGFAMSDTAAVVDAAHHDGAVCLIAHPGRGDGFTRYDTKLLDQVRSDIPFDGFEVYYPAHTPEQIAEYLDYAQKHDLLTSSGSDSHGPDKKPINYPAHLSRKLLERLGIQVK